MIDKKDLENTPICHIHNMIQDKCAELASMDNVLFNRVLELVDDILQLSFIAEDMGQRMENRLRMYKESIEMLGFERKK